MKRWGHDVYVDVPAWANFWDVATYRTFIAGVDAELRALGFRFRLVDGIAHVSRARGEHSFGLQNLAQKCRLAGPEHFFEVIRGHFQSVLDGEAEHRAVADQAANFAAMQRLLKVRLFAEAMVPAEARAQLVTRSPAPGLLATLVLDFPSTIATVARTDREAWSANDDEVFDTALANVATQEPPHVRTMQLDDDTPALALTGDSFFVASHVLRLGGILDPVPRLGALVAVPHRHALLVHPITTGPRVVRAMHRLLAVARGMFEEGPGSITDQLYWWRDGVMVHLPSTADGDRVELHPPARFERDVLAPLLD